MSALLLLSALLPLALAPLVALRSSARPFALRLAPWAAVPAFVLAAGAPDAPPLDLPWLLLGARVGLDVTGRVFLLFTALLWTVAGVYAESYLGPGEERGRFFLFYLLSLAGNLGLIVALDLGTFYLFFSLMTFSAYGLIVHEGGREAMRAGRVYIALAVVGEAMLLAGAVLAAGSAPGLELRQVSAALAASPHREIASALLFLGLGAKAGIMPLHVWLPLAHPVAPTPASAVLSGSMIKAGLLGWVRLLPPTEGAAMPEWGAAVIGLGLVTALLGAAIGVSQDEPKTVLAYSSVSQMGIMAAAIGVALLSPAAGPTAVGALLAYATHHALVKGALFLGVGMAAASGGRERRAVTAGLVLAALAMAGFPLTSGGVAKHYVVEVSHLAPAGWAAPLDLLLPLTTVGTTLLMARFLVRTLSAARTGEDRRPARGMWMPWLALLAAAAGALWVLPRRYPLGVEAPGLPAGVDLHDAIWPIAMGAALSGFAVLLARRERTAAVRFRIPPGDLLTVASRVSAPVRRGAGGWTAGVRVGDPLDRLAGHWYRVYAEREGWAALREIELRITRWSTAGVMLLLLVLALLAVLYIDGGW